MALNLSITSTGITEFQTALDQFEKEIQNQTCACLQEWSNSVRCQAQQLAPVRTGHLRDSIHASVQEMTVEIGAEAEYAIYVEMGTRHLRTKPFLSSTIEQNLPELEMDLSAAIDRAKTGASL